MFEKIKNRLSLKAAFLSLINAGVMLWITFFLLALPYVFLDELLLIQSSSIARNVVLGWQEKPDSSRFLFVDVAFDKELIDKNQEIITPADTIVYEANDTTIVSADTMLLDDGELLITEADTTIIQAGEKQIIPADTTYFPIGNEVITDRFLLAKFLEALARKKDHYKLILMDVNFMGASPNDSLLQAVIPTVPNLLISYHRDPGNKWKPRYPDLPIPKEKLSLSDIEKTDNMNIKFKLLHNDSIKTTPLRMQEILTGKEFHKGFWFYYLGDIPILNSFILDYRLRSFQFSVSERDKYAHIYLGETIRFALEIGDPELLDEMIHDLTKDRIIMIGDFDASNGNDIHETIYGDTQGPLILLNAFLAIEAGDNTITWQLLLFLFTSYFFLSYAAFSTIEVYGKWVQKVINIFLKIVMGILTPILKLLKIDIDLDKELGREASTLASFSGFTVILISISIVSYFLFNTHIGILTLAIYLNVMDKANLIFLKSEMRKKEKRNAIQNQEN